MSLGLIQPGALAALRHPKTGAILTPLYVRKNGSAVWPVMGAASDDPDDPDFTGEDDDTDEDEDDDDADDDKGKGKPKKKVVKKDDEDEDDEEDDDPKYRAVRQAKRYRLALRAAEKERDDLSTRLKALEDKDKPTDEVVKRDLEEARSKADKLAEKMRTQNIELAFFKSNTVDWVDPADALRLIDLDDIEVDDDGTVDPKALRAALKDLAKRKPHLVKPVKPTESEDDDDDEDDEEDERPRRSARTTNTKRRGSRGSGNRAALEKQFPVLRGR